MNCPFCAKEIKDEAIKCKHCGQWLEAESNPFPLHEPEDDIENPMEKEPPILNDAPPKTKPDYSVNIKAIVIATIIFVVILIKLVGIDVLLHGTSEMKWVNKYVGDKKPRLTIELPGELKSRTIGGQSELMQVAEQMQAYEYYGKGLDIYVYNVKYKAQYSYIINNMFKDLSSYIIDTLNSMGASNVQIINITTTQIKGHTASLVTTTMDINNQKYNDNLVIISDAGTVWMVSISCLNGNKKAEELGKRVFNSVSFEY